MRLSGNTILITGGSSGIGFEFAKQLSERGNTVIITGRDPSKLAKAKQQIPALHTVQSDVSRADQVKDLCSRILSEHASLNVLINNAGVMKRINLKQPQDQPSSLVQEIETNLSGPLLMVQGLVAHLLQQPSAAIVNVTSGLAFVPLPTSPVYCATKAALHSYTLSLRVQLKQSSVKVFEVAPPATDTEMLRSGDAEDLQGITIMDCQAMVKTALEGMQLDRMEIRPGQSNQLKLMSRLAPEFILKQLSRPVARMMAATSI